MQGYPKHIGTGQDLLNCLALVQTGQLEAADLKADLEAVQARAWLRLPVVVLADDRKSVTLRYCSEATVGSAISTGAKITGLTVVTDEDGSPAETVLTFSRALPEGTTEVYIRNPVDPYEALGTTEENVRSIMEVLRNYE